MAAPKKPAAKAKAPEKPKAKKGSRLGFFTVLLVLGFATPFMMPTVILVVAALFPTYIALATDNDPQKSGAVSVGAMNFAGTVPFIIDLWEKGQTMSNAFGILGNADAWLVILGAAAIGQMIVYTIPQAIATMTLAHAELRVKTLSKNLDMLKESWGADVATTKPIDKIGEI
ncbi:MAG: hypothetical protein P4M15_09320 [Alphaproteobacteria bacterium]|nr:hypothetical protein [Alphaproteobacteria bacterium]